VNASTPPPTAELGREQRRDRTARALRAAGATTDVDRRLELLDYVVRINMPVAYSVASRFFHRGIDEDDLVQVAYAALIRAARDFDDTRMQDFLSYAVPTIRGELKKHFRDHGWTVRPPRRVQEIQQHVARAQGDLTQQLGRSPTPSDLAAHLGLDLADVVEAMSADGCFTPASLDRTTGGQDGQQAGTLGELLASIDQARSAAEARTVLAPVVRQLKERDRRILYLRFFEQRTQQEIAEELGVTQMQVSRLLTRIMRDLRTELTAEPCSRRRLARRVAIGSL
jgi:RNA polymerase sigma-B factor